MAGFDAMDPVTQMTCHNGGNPDCKGGSGCCAMCGATTFFSEMKASILSWWEATGVSAVDQDGSESGTPCANASHSHHGINDSNWKQYKGVRSLYNSYLAAPMK